MVLLSHKRKEISLSRQCRHWDSLGVGSSFLRSVTFHDNDIKVCSDVVWCDKCAVLWWCGKVWCNVIWYGVMRCVLMWWILKLILRGQRNGAECCGFKTSHILTLCMVYKLFFWVWFLFVFISFMLCSWLGRLSVRNEMVTTSLEFYTCFYRQSRIILLAVT